MSGGIDPPGLPDGTKNPAGVGAPVPANDPGSPLSPSDPPGAEQGSLHCFMMKLLGLLNDTDPGK